MVGPLSSLVVFHIDFFFSQSLINQKNDEAKKLGPFNVSKVPEGKKHAKTCKNKQICFEVLNPNERGLF
jgi:hypothetical protein